MDSFISLFDPGCSDEPSFIDNNNCSKSKGIAKDDNENVLLPELLHDLPPEPQLGNIEYKLKLVSPSRQRFEHLVTQVIVS
jgi:hypothetical protein